MAINLQKHCFKLVVLLNVVIILTKLIVYKNTQSIAVFSSLTDSVLDLAISAINSFVFIYASKPKDDDHKFGHTAIEDLVAFFQIILIFASSVFMFYKTLGVKINYQFSWNYLLLMLVNAAPLLCIIAIQTQSQKQANSTIVKADLIHYSTDMLTLAGVVVAMILTHLTGFVWLDVACGALVIFAIAHSCFGGIVEAFHNLMAREINENEVNEIIKKIESIDEILEYKNLRTRRAGSVYFVNVDIVLHKEISLQKAHTIAHNLEDEIHKTFPNCDIIIHMEPQIS